MADRILKPDSGNDLVLQNDDGSGKIEINENASIPVTGTLDVSGATLTTSSAQKQAIVQAGPGSGTFDVSSGTFTTSSSQKTAIVDGGKGNLTKSDVGLSNVTNDAQVPASGGSFTGNVSFSDNNITNVGDIAVDTISSDAGTSIGVTLGTDAGDDFNVGSGKLVVEGDTGNVGIGTDPSFKLQVKGTVGFETTDSTNKWLVFAYTDDTLRFNYNGAGNDEIVIDSSGKFGLGTSAPDTLLEVNAGAAACITTDRSNSGAHIQFDSNGSEKGSISESGGTVSYNPFTGSHYGWIDGSCELGKVLIMTGVNQHAYNDATQEIIYGIEECSTENDSRFLGTYLSVMNPDNDRTIGDSDNSANPDLVMAVGNGKMWVVDEGSNITQGDHLITSSTQGHARKDPQTATHSYIIGRAGEAVDWSEVSETVGSKKHKLISVLFDVCIVKN